MVQMYYARVVEYLFLNFKADHCGLQVQAHVSLTLSVYTSVVEGKFGKGGAGG